MEFKKIKDIAEINPENITKGAQFKYINYLDTANITRGKIADVIKMDYINAPSRAKRVVRTSDIIYSSVRPNLCHYGILRNVYDNMIVSTGFIVLRCNERVIPEYLYSYITLPEITEKLNLIANTSTSTYPSIKPDDMGSLEIPLPDLKIQYKIAKILSNIDKKIELNNRINENLHEIIIDLYNEKITNSTNIDFESKTLDEFCNVFTGKKDANENDENGIYKFFTCAPEPLKINTFIYDGPAILISGNGAYTGRTTFYNGKFDLYQRTYGCTIKENINSDYIYLIYAIIKSNLEKTIMGGTHGSAIPYIVIGDISKFQFKYNKIVFDKLSIEIKSMLAELKENEKQNEILFQLRDTLLPKLINGEINVDNIEV